MRLISYGQFSHGVFRWTDETERFIGKSCQVLHQEHTGSKPTTSCMVAVKAMPVSLVQPDNDILVTKCACTISIPIYINRAWLSDVDLDVTTVESTGVYNVSGENIRPSVEGQDYVYSSGTITISSGNTYENFNIDLLDYSGDNVNNFFSVRILAPDIHTPTGIENRTICQNQGYLTKIIIQPTG